MLLLVSVGLGGANWRSIEPVGDVLSIALRHWSGELGDTDGPRRLGDDNLRKLLGHSPPPVVILSGIEESATELLLAGIAEDLESGHSMAAERQPRLLVTRSQVYKQLRTGTLIKLQAHFQRHWGAWLQAREACNRSLRERTLIMMTLQQLAAAIRQRSAGRYEEQLTDGMELPEVDHA